MDELFVGKMYYVSDISLADAQFRGSIKMPETLCKCTSKRGKFKIRDGVYRYMKYWVAEKEAKMVPRFTATEVDYFAELPANSKQHYDAATIRAFARDLQDARKELEEAKKDSVWRDLPDDVDKAAVHFRFRTGEDFYIDYTRTLPKTPKQELIDKFSEKNALAMKCANLSKEILEAFAKEYEDVMKPLDK